MDLVIKIDDEVKETFDKASKDDINGCFYDYKSCIGKAIKNGIPLPNGLQGVYDEGYKDGKHDGYCSSIIEQGIEQSHYKDDYMV